MRYEIPIRRGEEDRVFTYIPKRLRRLTSGLIRELQEPVGFCLRGLGTAGRIDFVVRSDDAGSKLFYHTSFHSLFVKSLRYRARRPVCLLLPCNSFKPEILCQTHFMTLRNLKRLGYLESIDPWVVAEPLGIYSYRDVFSYPAANYDFPPVVAGRKTRELMVSRLREWYFRVGHRYDYIVGFLTRYYRELAVTALGEPEGAVSIEFISNRRRLHSRSEQRRLANTIQRILDEP